MSGGHQHSSEDLPLLLVESTFLSKMAVVTVYNEMRRFYAALDATRAECNASADAAKHGRKPARSNATVGASRCYAYWWKKAPGGGLMRGVPIPQATIDRGEHRFNVYPRWLLVDRWPHACALLRHLGYRAIRPSPNWFNRSGVTSSGGSAHTPLAAAKQCGVGGEPNRSATNADPQIVFWLGEAKGEGKCECE